MRPWSKQLLAAVAFVSAVLVLATSAFAISLPENDYPTEGLRRRNCALRVYASERPDARLADEVLVLRRYCRAQLIPYADYASARTILMMLNSTNRYRDMFRSYGPFKEKIANLKRAQVEGELRCF